MMARTDVVPEPSSLHSPRTAACEGTERGKTYIEEHLGCRYTFFHPHTHIHPPQPITVPNPHALPA